MPAHRVIRTYTASELELEMLATIARYHGFSKSATITSLIRREFWRVFPAGTKEIRPERGARVVDAPGQSGERHGNR